MMRSLHSNERELIMKKKTREEIINERLANGESMKDAVDDNICRESYSILEKRKAAERDRRRFDEKDAQVSKRKAKMRREDAAKKRSR